MPEMEFGNLYDINKNLIKQYGEPLTGEKLKESFKEFYNYLNEHDNHYFMFLCREKANYTLFQVDSLADSKNSLINDLKECIENRGILYGLDRTKDKIAFEIWILTGEEMLCYYFFPYDSGVIEVAHDNGGLFDYGK